MEKSLKTTIESVGMSISNGAQFCAVFSNSSWIGHSNRFTLHAAVC